MKRLSASGFYLFPDDYFENLCSILEDRIHLCTVLSPEGEASAGGLFTAVNGIVQYHLSGTSDKHLKHSPSKLASDAIRRWAKENGNRICHFGGGLGGRTDSLFQFKAGFSKSRADFYTYRMILNESKYAVLTRLWREQQRYAEDHDTDFFPEYRKCA